MVHPVAYKLKKWIVGEIESSAFNVPSRWSMKYRRMKGGKRYSLYRFPYVREIMDSQASYNWIKKAAQTGLSETAIPIALFTTVRQGRDVAYYFPTKAKMTEFSCSRIDDGIMLSPFIGDRCSLRNASMKRFGPATLFLLGANSPSDLKSTAVGRLIMDEFDEWKTKRAVYLAMERLSGQIDEDVRAWGFSTPTLPGIGIDAKYDESTKELCYFDCPHCEEPTYLGWDEENGDFHSFFLDQENPEESYYMCWRCKKELPHEHKEHWLSGCYYKSANDDGNPVDPDPDLKRHNRGFWLPQMYSPSVTPETFALKYLRGLGGDIQALTEFYNSGVGIAFLSDRYRVSDIDIINAKRLEPYRMSDITLPVKLNEHLVTLGIDQGGPVHHWVAVSWKFSPERVGDPNDRAVGQILGCGRILQDEWNRVHDLMRKYQVRMAVVDYFPQPTEARKFARMFTEHVYLCQYVMRNAGREIRTAEEDMYGTNLVKVDDVSWLSRTVGRVISGSMKMPVDLPDEFGDHLKALIRTVDLEKEQALFKSAGDDHYAHALTYADIALKILDPSYL